MSITVKPTHPDFVTEISGVDLARPLKPADRDTLLLVDWAELTYDQAALALDVPVGTVRSRLNRARRKIREALDDIASTSPEEHHHD